MPYFVTDGVTAVHFEWDSEECDALIQQGMSYYTTVAGCVLHEGVVATAFDSAIRATPLFDAEAYLDRAEKIQVGVTSEYRICATPGILFTHQSRTRILRRFLKRPITCLSNPAAIRA